MCFYRLPSIQREFKIMIYIEEVAHGFHLSHHICLKEEAKSYKLHLLSHDQPHHTTNISKHYQKKDRKEN
jgi:hypothetical protein